MDFCCRKSGQIPLYCTFFQEVEAVEILNVEGDEEESSDDDSDAEGFDSDADDDGISANQWGRERKGLYGAE